MKYYEFHWYSYLRLDDGNNLIAGICYLLGELWDTSHCRYLTSTISGFLLHGIYPHLPYPQCCILWSLLELTKPKWSPPSFLAFFTSNSFLASFALKAVVFNHLFLTQCAKHSFISQRSDYTFLTVQTLVFTVECLTHLPLDQSDDLHQGTAAISRGHQRKGRDTTSPRYISCRSSMRNSLLNRSLGRSTGVEWILGAQWIMNFNLIQDSMMGIYGCRDNWSFLSAVGTTRTTSAFHDFILLPFPKP